MDEKYKDIQYYKFCAYGFLKNLRFFEIFFVLFLLEKGLSYSKIGILYAIKEILITLLEIPTGVFADSIGRKRTMMLSFISYILSFYIFYFFNIFSFFIGAMIFFSFGEAFRTGTHKAMIFEYLKLKNWTDKKVYYYGHTRSFSQLGSAVSTIIGGIIVISFSSYSKVFLYSITPYFLDLFLMISYPNELNGKLKEFKFNTIKNNILDSFYEFWNSFKDPKCFKAIANVSFYSGFYRAVKDYMQPILRSFALTIPFFLYFNTIQRSAIIISFVYFILYIISSYASRKSGHLCDKFNNVLIFLNITTLTGIFAGIISGFFYIRSLFILSIVFYIIINIIENIRKPAGVAYISTIGKSNVLATTLSAESQLRSLFASITSIVIGVLADNVGIGNSLIIVSSLLFLIFIKLNYFIKRKI